MRERVDEPVPWRLQPRVGVDLLRRLGEPPVEVAPVRVRGAPATGRWPAPAPPTRPPRSSSSCRKIPSPRSSVATVQAGRGDRVSGASLPGTSPTRSRASMRVKPIERVHLPQPLHRQHPGDLLPQLGAAVPDGQRQAAVRILLMVAEDGPSAGTRHSGTRRSTGSQARSRSSCSSGVGGGARAAVTAARRSSSDSAGHVDLAVQHVAQCLQVARVPASRSPSATRIRSARSPAFSSGRFRHHDDRLGGGEPQVRRADQHQLGLAPAAVLRERVQVRVAAPAPGQLGRAGLALCLVHRPLLAARLAADHRRRALAGGPVDHPQRRETRPSYTAAVVDPQVVGELVQVPVAQASRYRAGTAVRRAALARRVPAARCTWCARSRPGRCGTGECWCSRTATAGRACRSRCSAATAGTPGPGRRGRCPRLKLFRFGCQGCGRSWASGERRCMRTTSRSRGAWICGGLPVAAVPDPVPVVQPGRHDRELGQVHDRARARRCRAAWTGGPIRPWRGCAWPTLLLPVRVAERVDRPAMRRTAGC